MRDQSIPANKNKNCAFITKCSITKSGTISLSFFSASEMEDFLGLRRAFRAGKTRGIEWRMGQLRALLKLVAENEARFFEALEQDLGKHPVEAYRDEVFVLNLLSRLSFFLIDI